jgi:hypothetical protein
MADQKRALVYPNARNLPNSRNYSRNYQIVTRFSGATHILSPSLTSKALK